MTRVRAIILFLAIFALTLALTFPLGTALNWFGADKAGLSARAARGDIWTGQLIDARAGPVALGYARIGLKPLPLFVGRAEIGADTMIGFGRVFSGGVSRGIEGVTAKLPLAAELDPLPVETLELADASIAFRGGVCDHASGRVRATFGSDVAGLSLASGLSGAAKCDGRDAVLPLVSQSAMERLTVRVTGSGVWTAVLAVKAADPALAAKLIASGFEAVGGDYVFRLAGTL